MSWVYAGVAVASGVYSAVKARKAKKDAEKLIANKPKYTVSPGYAENKEIAGKSLAMAKNQAFGRDRSIMAQEKNIEQDSANAAFDAQNVSGSTSSLLNMLSQINNSKNTAFRNLAGDEAAIQNQKQMQVYNQYGNLMQANRDTGEENDKQWNYNVNDPYQDQLNMLVQTRKVNEQNSYKAFDAAGSIYAGRNKKKTD